MTANVMRREDNAQPSRLLLDVTLVGARTKQTLGACFLLLLHQPDKRPEMQPPLRERVTPGSGLA